MRTNKYNFCEIIFMFKLFQILRTDAKIVFLSSKIIYVTAISFLTALSQTKLDEKQIVDHNRSE